MTTYSHLTRFFEHDAPASELRYRGGALAAAWARLTRPSIFARIRVASSLVRALGTPDVLDIGCGVGHGLLAMCDAGANTVTGIDLSPAMMSFTDRRVRDHPRRDRIQLVVDDVFTWPARPASFDLVVAVGVVEYYADCSALLARMAELARGWVLFSARAWTPIRGAIRARHYARAGCPIHFLDRAEIDVLCDRAGYRGWTVLGPHGGAHLVLARR